MYSLLAVPWVLHFMGSFSFKKIEWKVGVEHVQYVLVILQGYFVLFLYCCKWLHKAPVKEEWGLHLLTIAVTIKWNKKYTLVCSKILACSENTQPVWQIKESRKAWKNEIISTIPSSFQYSVIWRTTNGQFLPAGKSAE